MMNPGRSGIGYRWIIECLFILFASFILLFASARILRGIALAHAVGQKSFIEKLFSRKKSYPINSSNPKKQMFDDKIRHVWGPAVAWKEMITKFSSKEKVFAAFVIGIELIMIFAMYMFPYIASGYGYEEAHWLYIYTFMGMGILSTAISSAGCITSEKEAQTWPLLLLTTLSDWQIIFGKFVGILKRCLPMWILLFIYFFPFINNSVIGIISLLLTIFLMAAMIFFLGLTGIYFSARYKNTNAAFLANIIIISAIWVLLPVIFDNYPFRRYMTRYINPRPVLEALVNVNPFQRAMVLVSLDNTSSRIVSIGQWSHFQDIIEYILLMITVITGYIITGFIFAWRAKCHFRKGIF